MFSNDGKQRRIGACTGCEIGAKPFRDISTLQTLLGKQFWVANSGNTGAMVCATVCAIVCAMVCVCHGLCHGLSICEKTFKSIIETIDLTNSKKPLENVIEATNLINPKKAI